MSTLSNSEDLDEMQHNAKILKTFRDKKLESSTCDPFKYTMGNPILNVSICIGDKGLTDTSNLSILHYFILYLAVKSMHIKNK